MMYIAMFDFSLAALVVVLLGFFVWRWIAFWKERMQQPIYREFAVPVSHNPAATRVRKRCA
jgi:hypothetical protein